MLDNMRRLNHIKTRDMHAIRWTDRQYTCINENLETLMNSFAKLISRTIQRDWRRVGYWVGDWSPGWRLPRALASSCKRWGAPRWLDCRTLNTALPSCWWWVSRLRRECCCSSSWRNRRSERCFVRWSSAKVPGSWANDPAVSDVPLSPTASHSTWVPDRVGHMHFRSSHCSIITKPNHPFLINHYRQFGILGQNRF